MSRVIFVQPNTRFDMDDAWSFGEPTFILKKQKGVDPFNSQLVMRLISEGLTDIGFDPTEDHVAMTGPTVLLNYLMLILGSRCESISLLVYDQREKRYRRQIIDLDCHAKR